MTGLNGFFILLLKEFRLKFVFFRRFVVPVELRLAPLVACKFAVPQLCLEVSLLRDDLLVAHETLHLVLLVAVLNRNESGRKHLVGLVVT